MNPPLRPTNAAGRLGLYDADDFDLVTGRCTDCATIKQALWYFEEDLIAVPKAGLPLAGFDRGVRADDDVRTWASRWRSEAPPVYPPLIWVGSPVVIEGARLATDGKRLNAGRQSWPFAVTAKISLNRSYYNATSAAFFSARPLTVHGTVSDGTLTARTIWPADFRLDPDPAAPTQSIEATPEGLRALVRAEPRGGAQSPFVAITLWERSSGARRHWEGKPVLGVMVNGAQGDDDEAHGGHFALVTGRVGPGGAIGDWLASNFYTLDSVSEKGIIAGIVPLDKYLADLNSGQAWYRPSYLMVAVLRHPRVAAEIQGALSRVFSQLYRHQLVYQHAMMNCAGISVDTLRALGWNLRVRGPTSRWLAAIGLPFTAAKERSLAQARIVYDCLTEDRTRLFPAAAFEEVGADLLRFAIGAPARPPSAFEAMLKDDLEALVFLRIPQIPSSRKSGNAPVVSFREYMGVIPRNPSEREVVPVPPRPFLESLRDADLLPPPRRRSDIAVAVWAVLSVVGIPWLIWRGLQHWYRRRAKATS